VLLNYITTLCKVGSPAGIDRGIGHFPTTLTQLAQAGYPFNAESPERGINSFVQIGVMIMADDEYVLSFDFSLTTPDADHQISSVLAAV
jgi:hypothetical protein